MFGANVYVYPGILLIMKKQNKYINIAVVTLITKRGRQSHIVCKSSAYVYFSPGMYGFFQVTWASFGNVVLSIV